MHELSFYPLKKRQEFGCNNSCINHCIHFVLKKSTADIKFNKVKVKFT